MSQPTFASGSESRSGAATEFGTRILAQADRLAARSETPVGLTCTYLSRAHRAVAGDIADLMQEARLEVTVDVVANVIGRYRSHNPSAKTLIVGSHYDTVRDAGKYDGRLGILTAIVIAEKLARDGVRLPFNLEIIAFSEEEGVRFSTSFIGSSAVAGRFDPKILERRDANGVSLERALRENGKDPGAIASLARPKNDLAGYLEVHIEQGPVLLTEGLAVGVVSEIAGNSRFIVTVEGEAGHSGTVPMALRHDAVAAAAEVVLLVERRCKELGVVGTVGLFDVPHGAINLVPGRVEFSLDVRSGSDVKRKAAVAGLLTEMGRIANRRGVKMAPAEVLDSAAVACSSRLQDAFAASVARAGFPVRRLLSGAGHDAVMFAGVTDIGMLFVRCGNGGVSHSPRETVTAEDADIGARILLDVLCNLSPA
jgi:allantoate deiminase/N-carbamoyl-L-amino-acid hydrolase